jgi:hypothetical protein
MVGLVAAARKPVAYKCVPGLGVFGGQNATTPNGAKTAIHRLYAYFAVCCGIRWDDKSHLQHMLRCGCEIGIVVKEAEV